MTVSESQTHHARNDAADSSPTKSLFLTARESMPVSILALTMFLLPAVGVPNEMMLQDTLKSAIVAHGVLIAALVFFWEQRKRREPLLWHGMVWLPVILMFYAMGSMVWSHTYLAGVEAIRWFTVALLMWLGLNTLTRENIPILFWGIHFGVVVASVWAALQFWLGWSLFPQAAQPASTFANRNFLAEYMVCSLPFSVYLLARMRNTSWLAPMAFSLALNIVALMMTGTRSALVALLVSIPALGLVIVRCRERWSFRRWNARNHALVGFTLVFAVWGLGSIPCGNANIIFEQRGDTAIARSFTRVASMTEREEYTQRSFSIRNQMWMATARMMLDYPWTGVGAGSWEVRIPLYQRTHTVLETDYYTHNEYLQLLSEYGLVVGGLSIAFLFAYFLHAAGTTYRLQLAGLVEHPVRAATLASLFSLLIVSVAGFPWHLASCCALLALGLSILAASDVRLKMQSPKTFRSIPWRPSFAYGCVAASMCLLLLGGGITYQAAQAERVAQFLVLGLDPFLEHRFGGAQVQRQALVVLLQAPHLRGALEGQQHLLGLPGFEEVLPDTRVIDTADDVFGVSVARQNDANSVGPAVAHLLQERDSGGTRHALVT